MQIILNLKNKYYLKNLDWVILNMFDFLSKDKDDEGILYDQATSIQKNKICIVQDLSFPI